MYDLTHPFVDGLKTFPTDPDVELTDLRRYEEDGYRLTGISSPSHAGTHLDAPAHTEPDGSTLGEIPPERFVFDGVVVDATNFGDREAIPPDLVPTVSADLVVFHTGWDEYWESERYLDHPYLAPETARACAEEGYAVGTDTLNPDPTPSPNRNRDEPMDVPAHHAILGAGELILENLTGLEALTERVEVWALPLALQTDGAPIRALARDL